VLAQRPPLSFAAPAVPRVPRRQLALPLAVLLLRSGVSAVDALDFVPMDAFQVSFWKRRRDLQEAYAELVLPARFAQGNISDPYYFDLVALAQTQTVAQAMRDGLQVFTERSGAEGVPTTVRRSPLLSDNAALPEAFARLYGELVYAGLRDGFEENPPFGAPAPSAGVGGVQQLLDCLVSHGFAFGGACEATPAGLRLRLDGACCLWACQSTARSTLPFEPLGYLVGAYLRAAGVPVRAWTSQAGAGALTQAWELG